MLVSDDSDFYIGEQQKMDQEEQNIEIEKKETLQNCALNQLKMKCKFVKIENRRGHPNFHFEIDGKSYHYGLLGIRSDNKITLRCTKNISGRPCANYSYIAHLDSLKQIMQDKSSKRKYAKTLDISDPRVYDLKNYDINSFDIGKGHKCSNTVIKKNLKSNNKLENDINELNYKIVKIENRRGHPNFHFEIDGKRYFYGIRGIRTDYTIILRCTKRTCYHLAFISPLDVLKQIMQDNSSKTNYSKTLDISDPRVYDLKNYDLNSFDIGEAHKCPGTEITIFSKSNNKPENKINEVKCKIVKIENRRGYPNFQFEIDEKMYFYSIRGIRTDYKIILRCTKRACNYHAFIAPLDSLKQIMQDNSSKKYYSKMLDKSDPRVYDVKNYDINSFDIGKGHNCS
jgi:predicted XRE-type DNA-binding protein